MLVKILKTNSRALILFWQTKNHILSRTTEESLTDAHGYALRGTPRLLLQRRRSHASNVLSAGAAINDISNHIELPERVIMLPHFPRGGFCSSELNRTRIY